MALELAREIPSCYKKLASICRRCDHKNNLRGDMCSAHLRICRGKKETFLDGYADATKYFSGFSLGGFGSHVEGAAQLIQIRGHRTFCDEFDKAILHSNASDLVRIAVITSLLMLMLEVIRISLEQQSCSIGSQWLDRV